MSALAFLYINIVLFVMCVAPLFMKQATLSLSVYQIAFYVSVVGVIISFFVLWFQKDLSPTLNIIFDYKILLILLVLGALAFIDVFAYGRALQENVPLGVILGYVRAGGTIATPVLGMIIFGEKLTPIQWGGILFSCIGMTMIIYPFADQ